MAEKLKRSRNIGDLRMRLIKKLARQKKKKEFEQKKRFDWEQLNPFNSEWLGGNREMNIPKTYQNIKDAWGYGDDKPMYDTEGEFEGKEIAEMNAILADPESSPPIQKIGSLLSAEGESPLDLAGREYMTRKRGQEASMADFGDEEGGGFVNEALGLLNPDSIGTPTDSYMSSENLKGESRYLNKLAFEDAAWGGFEDGHSSPELSPELISTDQYRDRVQKEPGATWRAELDENALDALARTEPGRLKAERAKKIGMADSGMMGGEEEGNWWDEVKGVFSSDSIGRDETLEQETKDNEALAGKIGAAAKLYSLLKPETPQAAPTIPTARITRGSVAFPGLKLASQKERRKYYTPKGLMA